MAKKNYIALALKGGPGSENYGGRNDKISGYGFGMESAYALVQDDEDTTEISNLATLVDKFHEELFQSGAVSTVDAARLNFGTGLESYATLDPSKNNNLLDENTSLYKSISDLVEKTAVPEHRRASVCAELLALVDNLKARLTTNHYVNTVTLTAEPDTTILSASRLVGAENMGNVETAGRITRALLAGTRDDREKIMASTPFGAMESFGVDSDKMMSDTRTAMVVILRRAMSSVTRRALHVVPHTDPVIKIAKVHPEIYDLNNMKSERREERGRYIQAITLYHFPEQVITTNTKVVLDQANDNEGSMFDANSILLGKKYSLKTLGAKRDGAGVRSPLDQTDLIDESPRLDFIKIKATYNNAGTVTEELFKISLNQFQERAKMVAQLEEDDTNDRALNRTFRKIALTATLDDGSNSSIYDAFTTAGARIRFDLGVNAILTLWSGDGHTNASVMDVEARMIDGGGSATTAVTTMLGNLTLTPVSFAPDARWRQENLRETSTFARMRQSSMAFQIPTGKAFGVSSSIQQQSPGTDQNLSSMLNEMINLGNDAKHISALSSSLAALKSRLDMTNRIPGDYADMIKRMTMDYIAGSLVNPTILDLVIDVANLGTTTLREQERSEDKTSAILRQLINCMAHAKTQSLIQRQIEPGEQMIWHGLVGRPLIDLIFSIPLTKQSQQVLVQRHVSGADLEVNLPNGDVLRLFGVDHANFVNKCWFLPMRSDPQSPLNYATIRDAGVFTHVHTNTNSGAVDNRAIATSREVVLPQCPVAICMQMKNLEYFEPQYNASSSAIQMSLDSAAPRIRRDDGKTVININGDTEDFTVIYSEQNP